jgi:pre-60S factor REI1
MFPTWQGCQQHMINKQHTKLRYEQGHWEEFDPFYDFKKEGTGFLDGRNDTGSKDENAMEVDGTSKSDDKDDEDGWEDISEGGDDDNDEESNELYEGFEKEIRRFGLGTTPLGELVFPDGRVVGHRALRRYYKQNLRSQESRTAAVIAAQEAAGERIYGGQVININQYNLKHDNIKGAGKGILVPIKQDGGGAGFSTLSLYRYQAAVRKQRRGDQKGQRLKEKSFQNINRMDKKHNRLMNGVSVAHAAR